MRVYNAIDRITNEDFGLRGKRLGLVTSPSGVTRELMLSIDVLHKHFNLVALYSPEHGVRGNIEAGGVVETQIDQATGLPAYSLYGGSNRPDAGMLQGIDILLMDVQDIGCRYYTYISTMRNCMEECARAGVTFAVLDRLNPIGSRVEGNLLDMAFSSFVGIAPIPQRHGLTLGELADLFNQEYGIGCDLQVIPVDGWQRDALFSQTDLLWVNPSPNVGSLETALLYPGTCMFEGTNLSEGRGTTKPFEQIGAPWLDAEQLAKELNRQNIPGLLFRPVYFLPTASKHRGTLCRGVQAHLTDPARLQPLRAGLQMLKTVQNLSGDRFEWLPPTHEKGNYFIDLLAGTDSLRTTMDTDAYWQTCQRDSQRFLELRKPYLRY